MQGRPCPRWLGSRTEATVTEHGPLAAVGQAGRSESGSRAAPARRGSPRVRRQAARGRRGSAPRGGRGRSGRPACGSGAIGRCRSTYQAAGALHGLRIAVYGDRGSLSWDHERAEVMRWRPVDGPEALLTKTGPMATDGALDASRFAAGHPDGYGLAFANLYRDFANVLLADANGDDLIRSCHRCPASKTANTPSTLSRQPCAHKRQVDAGRRSELRPGPTLAWRPSRARPRPTPGEETAGTVGSATGDYLKGL
ncbi:hypothetical protein JOF36_005598 [Pseudonocardia parietis]|uniref:Uncharacterized protein n=1 Tax=Pseudonocardia parietis TaxID=570936 RepID=A0ABS4W133_9PSEU|nr:hypothetical protein [Pseudonocardia parietis]